MVGYLPAVADADDGLRSVNAVVVVVQYPVAGEIRVDALQVGDEILQQLRRLFAVQLAGPVGVVGQINDVPAAVDGRVNHIGMLNDADERHRAVGYIEPVLGGQGMLEL